LNSVPYIFRLRESANFVSLEDYIFLLKGNTGKMKLILIAPSGGGKGSLAELIVKDFHIPNISTGDIFRKNMKEGTPLGKQAEEYVNAGKWVPDEVTINMLLDRISQEDCKDGYILDGFPRTLAQAKALAKRVDIDAVIELDVSDEMVMGRLGGRYTCKVCGKIDNARYEGFDLARGCRDCNGELFQRDDDKAEMIAKRLEQYHAQNKDILDFYRASGKLFSIKVQPEHMPIDTYHTVTEYLREKGIK
jgi:adenylate kinase